MRERLKKWAAGWIMSYILESNKVIDVGMNKGKVVLGQAGKRLLEEVVEEDFTKFLSTVRSSALSISASVALPGPHDVEVPPPESSHYPLNFFNIPSFDKLFLPLFYHHYQRFPYPHYKQKNFPKNNVPIDPPAFQLPFVELVSTSPCAGKTHLLYLICTLSVLPHSHEILSSPTSNPVILHLNGKKGTIVVLDSDNRFSVPRLSMIMRNYIYSHLHEVSTSSLPIPWIENLIHASIKHIHIFRSINSTQQLLSTLASLPKYFLSIPAELEQDRYLTGILVDSISTFYWEDRAADSIPTAGTLDGELFQQNPIPDTYVNPMITLAGVYQPIVTQLHSLQELFGCFVVVTRRMHMIKGRDEQIVLQNPLPGVWTMAVTIRFSVDPEHCEDGGVLHGWSAGHGWFRGRVETIGGMWGGRDGLEILKHGRNDTGHTGIRFSIGEGGVDVVDTGA
ncbi:hypothetical protein BGX38DRAFT_1266784 [Terfezia claveryi]|nr:hypothetical protein BGX38DRAFT_1266784 [Terfezia claveryi]